MCGILFYIDINKANRLSSSSDNNNSKDLNNSNDLNRNSNNNNNNNNINDLNNNNNSSTSALISYINKYISNRGPNSYKTCNKSILYNNNNNNNSNNNIDDNENSIELIYSISGSVLSLRGNLIIQPLGNNYNNELKSSELIINKPNKFVWNGEIFNGLDMKIYDNDTLLVYHEIQSIFNKNDNLIEITSNFINFMSILEGPFSFVYIDEDNNDIYFGRDKIGRRSLLTYGIALITIQKLVDHIASGSNNSFSLLLPLNSIIISSVGYDEKMFQKSDINESNVWVELPPIGIYSLRFSSDCLTLTIHPFINPIFPVFDPVLTKFFSLVTQTDDDDDDAVVSDEINIVSKPIIEKFASSFTQDSAVDAFINVLSDAIRRRVINIPKAEIIGDSRLGILFSGGIDCALLAFLASKYIPECDGYTIEESIDLINVAVGPSITQLVDTEDFNLSNQNNLIKSLTGSKLKKWRTWYEVPDRLASFNAINEFRSLSKLQKWRLIEVDITIDELEYYKSHILQLITPLRTIMDFNIGSVLWFGGRAEGWVYNLERDFLNCETLRYGPTPSQYDVSIDYLQVKKDADRKRGIAKRDKEKELNLKKLNELKFSNYHEEDEDCKEDIAEEIMAGNYDFHKSSAKVLFVGLGADEQLGGYGRHRTVFKNSLKFSEDAAISSCRLELLKDTCRLWRRNLGRDDRMVSDSSRECRHPFLDEKLISFLRDLPLNLICNLNQPQGCGDKKLLRLATEKLGLTKVCSLEKRAMQFGSRIANKDVSGNVEIFQDLNIREIIHPRSIRPESLNPGGRTKISSEISKISVKQKSKK